jgi:hypothetical protein
MNFKRKCKYLTCRECGVRFEPDQATEKRWADLCGPHRIKQTLIDRRRDAVISWATSNWEALEPVSKLTTSINQAVYGSGGGGGQTGLMNSLFGAGR